jgi:IS1 family transposase/transposase-like protein
MPECKNCKSKKAVKNGEVRGKQRYKCKECGYNFVEGDGRTNEKIIALKALVILLYSLSKGSYNMLGKIFNRNRSLIYRWIKEAGLKFDEPDIDGEIKEIEFDEMWHFIGKKKRKLWLIKAIDRRTGRTVAWVLGNRDTATFRRLYNKVKHLKNCIFYTDNWDAFAKVLPQKRHVIGKTGTVSIERDNSNTRHHLGRFTRKTKVVSKSEEMVDISIKLWYNLTKEEIFKSFQRVALSIFT